MAEVLSGPIQTLPRGLLGFMQLKNSGRYPSEVSSTLGLSLELFDWYMEANAENLPLASTAAIGPGAVGFVPWTVNPIVVPDNEMWFVTAYSGGVVGLIATDSIAFILGYTNPVGGAPLGLVIGGERQGAITGAANTRQGRAFWNGFFAPPGCTFGISLQQIDTAATLAFGGYMRRVRLPL